MYHLRLQFAIHQALSENLQRTEKSTGMNPPHLLAQIQQHDCPDFRAYWLRKIQEHYAFQPGGPTQQSG